MDEVVDGCKPGIRDVDNAEIRFGSGISRVVNLCPVVGDTIKKRGLSRI
jgi:hypothetical protein